MSTQTRELDYSFAGFSPSDEQRRICEAVAYGTGNLAISAVAGSGKTTTILLAVHFIPLGMSSIYVVFNKHNAISANEKFKKSGMAQIASTLHSLGYRNLMAGVRPALKLTENKYSSRVYDWAKNMRFSSDSERDTFVESVRNLIDGVRLKNVDFSKDSEIIRVAEQYGHYVDPDIIQAVRSLLDDGYREAIQTGRIDFTDMIWVPIHGNMTCKQFDFVLVDEAQDLNELQIEFVRRTIAPGGRSMFVGDRKQSIMGFAYSDTQSFVHILEAFNAELYPLTTCYRCPTTHIDAAALYAEMQPRDGAPEGEIISGKGSDFVIKEAQPGDLIIGRYTAPLVSLCLRFISNRIAAKVRGKDIGRGLASLARNVVGNANYEDFEMLYDNYLREQQRILKRKANAETAIERFMERAESLYILWAGSGCKTLPELLQYIDSIFSDDTAVIVLSTIHRAKGLEADRVYIYGAESLPAYRPYHTEEQKQQERNLHYVALTRAKKKMGLVSAD